MYNFEVRLHIPFRGFKVIRIVMMYSEPLRGKLEALLSDSHNITIKYAPFEYPCRLLKKLPATHFLTTGVTSPSNDTESRLSIQVAEDDDAGGEPTMPIYNDN
jgi:hypothetical protein